MQGVTQTRNRYIVGLDGLRALAVIAVVAYHLAPKLLPGGYIGVDIFFVISGFLITTLLINEHVQKGSISFKKFWMRRARRLLPALAAVIGIVSSIAFFIKGDILVGIGRQIAGAMTFSTNWVEIAVGTNYFNTNSIHLFSNFWSLAVEEQFYALWPCLMVSFLSISFLARRPRSGMWICIALALVSAVLMALLFNGTDATRVYYGTDTHLFGLMAGAALAFWKQARFRPSRLSQKRKSLQYVGILGFVGIAVMMGMLSDQLRITYLGGLPLASILSTAIILAVISAPGLLRRLFTLRPLEWIGVRSYGIYLWHWPLLVLLRYVLPTSTPLWIIAGLTCVCTVFAAGVSFRYLETPIRLYGLRTFLARSIKRQEVVIDTTMNKWKLRPHPILFSGVLILIFTVGAVVVAPTKTRAQLNVEAGERAVSHAKRVAKTTTSSSGSSRANLPGLTTRRPPSIAGSNITLVGDSVALAAAPALEQRFPGILVDALVSRSLRGGGFDTVSSLAAAGNLRGIVIIALGTNGFYGTGELENLMAQLGNRKVIFVTSYADRDWTAGNNDYLRLIVKNYPNASIADWYSAISNHTDDLVDGIHPDAAGGDIYATCIATALAALH